MYQTSLVKVTCLSNTWYIWWSLFDTITHVSDDKIECHLSLAYLMKSIELMKLSCWLMLPRHEGLTTTMNESFLIHSELEVLLQWELLIDASKSRRSHYNNEWVLFDSFPAWGHPFMRTIPSLHANRLGPCILRRLTYLWMISQNSVCLIFVVHANAPYDCKRKYC